MREIKFRCWDIDERKFVVNETDRLGCGDTKKCMSERVDFENNSVEINADERYIFSEYTGLEDKNGKEIYEGDIFHIGSKKILYVVEWIDCGLKGSQIKNKSWIGLDYWKDDIEVIGNIYENPELLKVIE